MTKQNKIRSLSGICSSASQAKTSGMVVQAEHAAGAQVWGSSGAGLYCLEKYSDLEFGRNWGWGICQVVRGFRCPIRMGLGFSLWLSVCWLGGPALRTFCRYFLVFRKCFRGHLSITDDSEEFNKNGSNKIKYHLAFRPRGS